MKVLLDTNIIIHREASTVVVQDIGVLFYWLDRLKLSKYVHPLTITELNRNKDIKTANTMRLKLASYNVIKNLAPINDVFQRVCESVDVTENDRNDTEILNEVFSNRG